MLARTSLAVGFSSFFLLTFGCTSQSPHSIQPQLEGVSAQHPARVPQNSPAPAQPVFEQPSEIDDASLLARKTSEYANSMSGVLAQQPGGPATRPSIVQWLEPAHHQSDDGSTPHARHAHVPNQPASLAAVHLPEDTSVPLILPESADQIPPASSESAGSPVAIPTDEYELKLRKLVEDYPRDLGNQLDYQLLRLVRDEPTPDLSVVSQLSSEDRDLLLALMDGLTNFRAAARGDGNLMLNRKIQPLLEMAERLHAQGQLAIPTVAFCTQVESFGVYRPMVSSRFLAGRENDLIVYNEAANFTSVQGNDTIWRTRLRQEMVLYTDTGLVVWPEKSNAATFLDQSRNRRHDFFISRLVRLPASLAVGKYVLKIILTDEESNRVAEASARLEIYSDAASSAQPAAETASPNSEQIAPQLP
jgi:hypothetical protein